MAAAAPSCCAAGCACCPKPSGLALVRDPHLNKTLGFGAEEKHTAGIHGLVPATQQSLETQVASVVAALGRLTDDLSKFEFLMRLHDSDTRLFFATALAHTSTVMPLVYTPVVGAACQNYGKLVCPRRGLWITIDDLGSVDKVLANWPEKNVKAIVVTDGERILGLGDLGAHGMGIPVGKLALYSALAGVDPRTTLPITLDVGTNNAALRDDPTYLGLRRPRESGEAFYALVDEFVHASKARYGEGVLIQWEDFGNSSAFKLLHKYQDTVCSFNDDIQGTASVIVAGLLASARVTQVPLSEGRYLFFGAGEAGVGIADLLAYAISLETGKPLGEIRRRIYLVDSKGLVVASRKSEPLAHHKEPYAHEVPFVATLLDAVNEIKPTALIGVSAQPQTFTKEVVEAMCAATPRPCIFALSNPTSKAECTAEQAYTWSEGKAVFASGSPFDPVTLPDGRTFVPGQGNNSFIFPAVGLATIACGIKTLSDHSMYVAAHALAEQVTDADLATGCLYPPISTIRAVSAKIATAVAEDAYAKDLCTVPRPADLAAHIKASMWEPTY